MFEAELLDVHTPFPVGQGIALESGRNSLFGCGLRKKVPGDLLEAELVERHVLIEGIDDPLTITPGMRSYAIALVAVTVGVACQIQPVKGPSLPVMRRGEEPVNHTFVSIRTLIAQVTADLVRRRGQADQVQADPSDEGILVGFGRG